MSLRSRVRRHVTGENRGDVEWVIVVLMIVAFAIYGLASTGALEDVGLLEDISDGPEIPTEVEGPTDTTVNVSDGEIVPDGDASANVTLIGAEFGESATVRIHAGGQIYDPWPADVTEVNETLSLDVSNLTESENISVTAEYPGGAIVNSTDVDDPRVRVLHNGDVAPNVTGLGDQASASEIVDPYVNDGTVDLDPNQAIFLFELWTTNTSAAEFDLQDVVVLVTIDEQG